MLKYGTTDPLPFPPVYRHKTETVHKDVGNERETCGNDDIREGMLFDKHRRKDDQDPLCRDRCLDPQFPENTGIRVPRTDHDGERVVNMNTGCYVGRCIDRVQPAAQIRQNIVSRHGLRPKIQDIRKKDRDDQKNGHADRQECTDLVIAFLITH